MILGVDPGIRFCGWSVVEETTARVLALGVIHQERDPTIPVSCDRARRACRIARSLVGTIEQYDCGVIAAEAMLFHGAKNAIASLSLAWGSLSAIAVLLQRRLFEVPPKRWQHAVAGDAKARKIHYPSLELALDGYVRSQAEAAFSTIPEAQRNHALDATGIAMYAALGHPMFAVDGCSGAMYAEVPGGSTASPDAGAATGA